MIKKLNIFGCFLIAPVVGFFIAFYLGEPFQQLYSEAAQIETEASNQKISMISRNIKDTNDLLIKTKEQLDEILATAKEQKKTLDKQREQIEALVTNSKAQTMKSNVVLEQVLSNLLGNPIYYHNGSNSTIKVYSLEEAGYRGFMAKVNVHNSNALKVVLADDQIVNNGETTSQAAKRKNGILAVNAGGFWPREDGKLAALGSTVVDGTIKRFSPSVNLSFVGFNQEGHLVGGKIKTREELQKLNVLQGASFVPTLLQDGKKMSIPADWANAKNPRTIVGNFSNGELLFIVIDGRRKGWSSGVTLEELQDKLLSFKIKDAFNLDGGGSSAFYFDGSILNRPSDGKERRVTSNIVIMP